MKKRALDCANEDNWPKGSGNSGLLGVSETPSGFLVRIKDLNLGYFETREAAGEARLLKVLQLEAEGKADPKKRQALGQPACSAQLPSRQRNEGAACDSTSRTLFDDGDSEDDAVDEEPKAPTRGLADADATATRLQEELANERARTQAETEGKREAERAKKTADETAERLQEELDMKYSASDERVTTLICELMKAQASLQPS